MAKVSKLWKPICIVFGYYSYLAICCASPSRCLMANDYQSPTISICFVFVALRYQMMGNNPQPSISLDDFKNFDPSSKNGDTNSMFQTLKFLYLYLGTATAIECQAWPS